ncbi:MAG: DUF1361 domain-containing protein [Crocinitomicaceae bacterium]|nr:DUF1361 domain-containing protein [Crocinitomicaceae bacterium]
MLDLLRKQNRLNETLLVAIATSLCIIFSIYRVIHSGNRGYFFLNWNLFLALVPWLLTSYVLLKKQVKTKKSTIAILLFSWLIFFPNAPYILTDLFHLRWESSMPIWFDLTLILFFAWTGLIVGFMSLWDIERLLQTRLSNKWISILSSSLLFLSSFGIYLGRYLRWNSWDLVRNPFGVLFDIGDRVVHPFEHPRTWGMTLFMGIFLNLVYWTLKLIRKRNHSLLASS